MGNNNKQTAVQWLIEQLIERQNGKGDSRSIDEIYEQANKMFEKQIIDAFWNGDNTDCLSEQNSKEFAEQYYNETYKN